MVFTEHRSDLAAIEADFESIWELSKTASSPAEGISVDSELLSVPIGSEVFEILLLSLELLKLVIFSESLNLLLSISPFFVNTALLDEDEILKPSSPLDSSLGSKVKVCSLSFNTDLDSTMSV